MSYIPKETLSCFLDNFESPPLRLSAVRLRCSQFSQNISPHFTAIGDMSLQKIHRYGSCSFVLICRRFRNHRALPPFPSEKLVHCSFWRFVDTRPIVWPRLRTHFVDILKSQLVYTAQLIMIKGGLTLILFFPKAWFLLRIRRSNFCCFLHRPFRSLKVRIAYNTSKTASIAAEQRALLVFPARNSV